MVSLSGEVATTLQNALAQNINTTEFTSCSTSVRILLYAEQAVGKQRFGQIERQEKNTIS